MPTIPTIICALQTTLSHFIFTIMRCSAEIIMEKPSHREGLISPLSQLLSHSKEVAADLQ